MLRKQQYYKGVPLRCIIRDYGERKAKRFTINGTNQNVWIPNVYLEKDGTLKRNINIDFVFHQAKNQLEIARIYYDKHSDRWLEMHWRNGKMKHRYRHEGDGIYTY